jgi:hypothetical protein
MKLQTLGPSSEKLEACTVCLLRKLISGFAAVNVLARHGFEVPVPFSVWAENAPDFVVALVISDRASHPV